jgi:nucleotide-binding universal stress UspA family protein
MRTAEANPSEAASLEAPGRPRTVVVGLDGSACAGRALARAAALIDDDGLLVLVAVDPEMHSPGILAAPLLDTRDGDAARLLAAAREQVPPEFAACPTMARRGDPAEILTEIAREQRADLLVVGRRGRDFAARVLLGSVASRLTADAPCDVLVVR